MSKNNYILREKTFDKRYKIYDRSDGSTDICTSSDLKIFTKLGIKIQGVINDFVFEIPYDSQVNHYNKIEYIVKRMQELQRSRGCLLSASLTFNNSVCIECFTDYNLFQLTILPSGELCFKQVNTTLSVLVYGILLYDDYKNLQSEPAKSLIHEVSPCNSAKLFMSELNSMLSSSFM